METWTSEPGLTGAWAPLIGGSPGDLPVVPDADGVLRVGGTRVRLETIVNAFQLGCTAEEILFKYPSLELGDIYGIITAYLRHPAEIGPYLESRRLKIEKSDREIESRSPAAEARERLLARRQVGK